MQLVFNYNFWSVRVIFEKKSSFDIAQDDRTMKISLKTVLDTFFVKFLFTKNTRTYVDNNCTQRVNYIKYFDLKIIGSADRLLGFENGIDKKLLINMLLLRSEITAPDVREKQVVAGRFSFL